MKKLYFLLILSLSTFTIYSQKATEFDKNYVQANKEFELGNYYAVLPLYSNLRALDSTNANLNYLIGYSYLKARSGRFKSIP
jgi:hypothetical protein